MTALCQWNTLQGEMAERYAYDAFGNVRILTPGLVPLGASRVGNTILFTGRRRDGESGLYDYRTRMYNPALGRFMQTDPLGYIDGMNLYQYCGNNPVNWIDPWGLESVLIGWLKGFREGAREGDAAAAKQVKSYINFLWLTARWATGITPSSTEYGPGTPPCEYMRDAKSVQKAREKMKNNIAKGKVKPIKESGEQSPFYDDSDGIEQFVGGYSIEVVPHLDRGTIEFILRNTSSMDSALGPLVPFPSYKYGPGSDWQQVIRWEESI